MDLLPHRTTQDTVVHQSPCPEIGLIATCGLNADGEAHQRLCALAELVQPLLAARCWHVDALVEITLEESRAHFTHLSEACGQRGIESVVTGVNVMEGGRCTIGLMLRYGGMRWTDEYHGGEVHGADNSHIFVPRKIVLGKLLHELAHCAHRDHSDDFWVTLEALTEQLTDETRPLWQAQAEQGHMTEQQPRNRGNGRDRLASAARLRHDTLVAQQERARLYRKARLWRCNQGLWRVVSPIWAWIKTIYAMWNLACAILCSAVVAALLQGEINAQ